MSQEIREISEGAAVSVVLGEDKAPASSDTSADHSTETTLGD